MSSSAKKKIITALALLIVALVSNITSHVYTTNTSSNKNVTKESSASSTEFVISRIVDGDTIDICSTQYWNGKTCSNYSKIRLIGVNTPESVDPRRAVQCFGKEASSYIASLVPIGTGVAIASDSNKPNTDQYGRLLRYVYRDADQLFINRELIKEGYAYEAMFGESYQYHTEFLKLQAEAKKLGKGLWSDTTCAGKK